MRRELDRDKISNLADKIEAMGVVKGEPYLWLTYPLGQYGQLIQLKVSRKEFVRLLRYPVDD